MEIEQRPLEQPRAGRARRPERFVDIITQTLSAAGTNLLQPAVLFFALGVLAALARSDLALPREAAKTLALVLMLCIGFKGGVEARAHGLDSGFLKAAGLGIILDIVPNHMGIAGNANAWWLDVLENGASSAFAHVFDIDWDPVKPELKNRVLLPVLGVLYGKALERFLKNGMPIPLLGSAKEWKNGETTKLINRKGVLMGIGMTDLTSKTIKIKRLINN